MANNAIKNLIGNRDAIRKIMALDANGTMDNIVENARKSGALVGSEDGFTYNGGGNSSQTHDNSAVVVNEQVMAAHSRMPRQILESFKKNPGKTASTSVLGGLSDEQLAKMRPILKENATTAQQQTISSGIDYSLLKTIINEAVQENVKKYMSAMAKKLINEGVGNVGNNDNIQAIKLGESFSFITKNGDVYEAKLTKKYNINSKTVNG